MKSSTRQLICRLSRLRVTPDETNAVLVALKRAFDRIAAAQSRLLDPGTDTPDSARS